MEHLTISRRFHPVFKDTVAALGTLYIAVVWIGFSGSGYADYLVVVVTLFVLGALTLPFIAVSVWKANKKPQEYRQPHQTFREQLRDFRVWLRGDIEIGEGHTRCSTATIEALLPIAAVSFGMLAFAIVALALT